MRDLQQTRRTNLRLLVEQWGGASGLAKKLGYAGPSYISQLLGENRPVTEKTARSVEQQLDLPAGWLDNEPEQKAVEPARVDVDLVTRSVLAVGKALEREGSTVPPSKFADLVAVTYEAAVKIGAVDQVFVDRLVRLTR